VIVWYYGSGFTHGGTKSLYYNPQSWVQRTQEHIVVSVNFTYASDPIISGMILDSATAFYPTEVRQSADSAQSNFTAVIVALSCRSAPSQLDCLRKASWQDIASVLKEEVSLKLLPVVDERIVFSDYSRRYEEAAVSPIPAIIGTNQHEYNIGVPQPLRPNFT
jgi:acetylcholinesterase